ncbi:MAG: hypothetical protein RBT63_07965 [Bdellovibrionales bacterium]|nr:hypothetical protein [Bdellovibrionales bacterium]
MSESSGKAVSGLTGAAKSLAVEIERLKFDKRLLDFNLSRKRLSKEDLQKHLESLPDLADSVVRVDLENEGLN